MLQSRLFQQKVTMYFLNELLISKYVIKFSRYAKCNSSLMLKAHRNLQYYDHYMLDIAQGLTVRDFFLLSHSINFSVRKYSISYGEGLTLYSFKHNDFCFPLINDLLIF